MDLIRNSLTNILTSEQLTLLNYINFIMKPKNNYNVAQRG